MNINKFNNLIKLAPEGGGTYIELPEMRISANEDNDQAKKLADTALSDLEKELREHPITKFESPSIDDLIAKAKEKLPKDLSQRLRQEAEVNIEEASRKLNTIFLRISDRTTAFVTLTSMNIEDSNFDFLSMARQYSRFVGRRINQLTEYFGKEDYVVKLAEKVNDKLQKSAGDFYDSLYIDASAQIFQLRLNLDSDHFGPVLDSLSQMQTAISEGFLMLSDDARGAKATKQMTRDVYAMYLDEVNGMVRSGKLKISPEQNKSLNELNKLRGGKLNINKTQELLALQEENRLQRKLAQNSKENENRKLT